jgi:AcrR family transcriptional regulator
MSPEQRRSAIVDATVRVLLRQGIAATTVRDVAAEMGTSSGLIHHYFESMDELLAEAFGQVASHDLARSRAAIDEVDDPVRRLAVFFATYNRADEQWSMQVWLDAWAEAARRPALQRTSRRLNVEWQGLVVGLINRGVRAGAMTCADPDAVAWRIISLLDGLALQSVAHADLVPLDDASTWARDYAEHELGLTVGALDLAHVNGTPLG